MSDANPLSKLDKSGVSRRNEQFAKRIATKIWHETPSATNPYIAESSRCHGYDLLELIAKRSYPDFVYLLFKGELPSPEESRLFEKLMMAFINPGPRHPATRAAMNAGVSKTDHVHLLPISLTILGGEHLGAAEVELSIRWLGKNVKRDPVATAGALIKDLSRESQGDVHIAPGFGSHYGDVDQMVVSLVEQLLAMPAAGRVMRWADEFARALAPNRMGWLSTGVVAAVLSDLGFQPRVSVGLFQIMSAPGLFAHGIEMATKPLTAMPFPDDKEYFIEDNKNDE